jgi:uncharacterized membrane protein (DUF373 family)
MSLREEWAAGRARWAKLTLYQQFEHAVILILTGIIAIVIVAAVWNLALNVMLGVVLAAAFDPSNYAVFQTVFGMMFTVIIALEFKKTLVVVSERQQTTVQVRAVVLIALLAVVRKVIILDLAATEALQVFALAAAILALGAVYWLVRYPEVGAAARPATTTRRSEDSDA